MLLKLFTAREVVSVFVDAHVVAVAKMNDKPFVERDPAFNIRLVFAIDIVWN